MAEIYQVADRVTVFKDGKVVGTAPVSEIDRPILVRMMIGRSFSETFPPRGERMGEEVLGIKNLSSGGVLEDINLNIHRGEIVGIAGLTGAGRTELARAIFGARPVDRGEICINGNAVSISKPSDALQQSIGFLTEDRNDEGLVLALSIKHNAALPSLKKRQRWGIINWRQEEKVVKEKSTELNIRATSLNQNVEFLSGGNRQKVVLAKWLITNPDLLIFDEPTRGGRRPVAVTVEQRPADSSVHHPGKRLVMLLGAPVANNLVARDEALDAQPFLVRRAAAEAAVVGGEAVLKAQVHRSIVMQADTGRTKMETARQRGEKTAGRKPVPGVSALASPTS